MQNLCHTDIKQDFSYDSFGMITMGRSWEVGSGYRYGFGGQEQDDEVYENGNLNTAQFWEFDTRLGRRWNMDKITNPYLSPYVIFSNNPIIRIDPYGDDDYFDINGNYLGYDGNGHNIKIVKTTDVNVSIYKDPNSKIINPESITDWCFLADYQYTPRDLENQARLAKIIKHYTGESIGATEADPSDHTGGETLAWCNPATGNISIRSQRGRISKYFNNYYILKSIINDHEKIHRKDPNPMTYEAHVETYINQVGQDNFKQSPTEFQLAIIASMVNYAVNSGFKENTRSLDSWQERINTALANNNINYSISIQDSNKLANTTFIITDTKTGTQTDKNSVENYKTPN